MCNSSIIRKSGKKTNFGEKVSFAKVGEDFVYYYADQIFPPPFRVIDRDKLSDIKVKGADIGGYIIRTEKDARFITGFTKGVIEVKQNRWESGTAHNALPIDTVPINFEIREDQRNINSSPGWLRAMMHPEAANEYAKTHETAKKAIQSAALVYMLERWRADKKSKPEFYAAICFYDIPALMQRLHGMMPTEWDLNDPRTIPQTANGCDIRECGSGTYLSLNQWFIPFKELEDLATVTMIDNAPIMDHVTNNKCEKLKERVEHLQRKADGRKIDTSIPLLERDKKAEEETVGVYVLMAQKLGAYKEDPNNEIIIEE